jgi:septum formation protein
MSRYPHIVLASASPRRASLLELIGVTFDVCPADIDEEPAGALGPAEGAESVARDKALAVAGTTAPDRIVLGADTVVVLDDAALGKPEGPAEARHMLRLLSGRSHVVATGVALASSGGLRVESWVVETTVTFRDVSDAEIGAYVDSGRPMDKAGAYGIQEDAAAFVERVDGCYYSVVGLPLARLSVVLAAWPEARDA